MKIYDTLIIGFGKAGKTLAAALSKKGESVALVEKDSAMYGGTCINVGCIPSKRLITEAALAPEENFALQRQYYKTAVENKNMLTGALRTANYNKLIEAGVDVIDGTASFLNAASVEVTGPDGKIRPLEAKKFVIDTGSYPFIPPALRTENNPHVYVSESIMDLTELPERLTVIGGGYIGLEFSSMYANFGSKVTIVQREDTFLPREDEDIAQSIRSALESKGVKIITAAQTERIDGANLTYIKDGKKCSLAGDAVLLAVGRRPNVDALHAEKAGITLTEKGAIAADEHLRTSAPNIWAAGDVCGNLQFTYISLDDSRIILSDMYGAKDRTTKNRGAFTYSVFIDPPYSKAGIGEKEADAKKLDYRVVKMKAAAVPKAKVLKKSEGMLKALIDNKTGLILGAALFCAESHEIINAIKLSMDNNLPYTALRDFIYTHPTMSEGLNDLFSL
ncbi:FAD-dependent oxidoreductase [Treponema parvum]|uniref:FAD-dependent oxidoreductase n=1 Tax=Treponema parvum TaxID=138851 RepID=A0A975F326_9SPIR|nr:FAD-dependent oxidoreductase [Treponema parvum]QTQ13209.1 FAD-dependent oxidoreductase [Treponema parvum]